MPYALFPPRSPHPHHPYKRPLPKYTTNDPSVAQVFHSYGWPILHVALSSLPPRQDMEKSWETIVTVEVEDEKVEDEDEHVEEEDKGEDDGSENQKEEEKEEEEEVSSITRLGGVMELHFAGIVLDRWMFEGEQVEERLKENVMWMAGWTTDRVVDLRYVGL